jgi:hypothetical protein
MYIKQDKYLSRHRGEYAQRNGVALPMISRLDVSLSQQVSLNLFGKVNSFAVRLDVLNFTNLINRNWGVGKTLITNQPLLLSGVLSNGEGDKPVYTLRAFNNSLIKESYINTATLNDVFRIQLSLKWDLF